MARMTASIAVRRGGASHRAPALQHLAQARANPAPCLSARANLVGAGPTVQHEEQQRARQAKPRRGRGSTASVLHCPSAATVLLHTISRTWQFSYAHTRARWLTGSLR